MSRSIKKGPFCAPELLKRVDAMNQKGEKKVLKTWSRASTIFPAFVGHTFAVHDGRTCPSTSPRTWWAISWANSCRPAPLRDTRAARPASKEERNKWKRKQI